ncbi:MAG: hypothetical protein AABX24_00580 [Nanoarchaeota archaeon]
MISSYHLPVFAKQFAQYLQDNLIGRLSADDIKIKIEEQHHTLSMQVYLHDASFGDEIPLGEYSSHYVGNQKIKQEFRSDSLLLGSIHLIYETGERKDLHTEIPFP